MAKKSGRQPKVLPYSSVNFGDYGIVTTYEQPDIMSQQKWSEIPIEARKQYEKLDMSEAPFAQASTRDSLRKYSHGLFVQGSLGPEYMGSHGVGGLIAPPMEYFDDRLDWFRAREDFQEDVRSWREHALSGHGVGDVEEEEEEEEEDDEEEDEEEEMPSASAMRGKWEAPVRALVARSSSSSGARSTAVGAFASVYLNVV